MDNLAKAVKFGYITDKEAQLLELLDMPARDAKPPKGVPKTHVPKKDGKTYPKEKLKKLSPKQKATLKAKTDGKVEKTKHGIDSFMKDGSYGGGGDHTSGTGGGMTNGGGDGGGDGGGGGNGIKGNSAGSAGASNYSGDGVGGQVNMDHVGGDTGNSLVKINGQYQIKNKETGQRIGNDGKAYDRAVKQHLTPVSLTTTSALAPPVVVKTPIENASYFGDIPTYAGTPAPAKTVSVPTNNASYFSDLSSYSETPTETGDRGTPGMNQGSNSFKGGTGNKGSQGSTSRDDGMRAPAGTGNSGAATNTNTQSGDGKGSRENVTTIDKTEGPVGQVGPADQNVYKGVNQPANVTFADKTPPSDLDDVMPSVTAAERAVMNKVKSPTSFARIDSPSSLANLGTAGSVFESPLADRPGAYSDTELSDIVGGKTPARANAPTREAYADNIASDPTAGRTNDSLASLAGNPEKITDRMTPGSTMAENYAAYRSPPTQASVEAARAAILGDVAQAAGTFTAPYDVKAPVAQPAGTFTAGYDVKNPAAVAAGTLTTPYNPADDSVEDLTQEAYNRANAIPGVQPAQAAGTLTSPYNAVRPDSPLSPLATANPRALGVDKYTGSGTSSLASLSTPQAPPANDNDSTIADQNFPDTSTITDQNLPGGLPSPPSGGAPTFGQGGQGAQVTGTAPAPVTPPVVTPPPPVVEQTDPYAGIMPWDRIAYDAIRTSYESRGEAYTPQQFITSFYNQKKAA